MIGKRNQAAGCQNIDLGAGPGRLGAAFRRTDQALAERVGADRRRQGAGDRGYGAIEIEFADHDIIGQRVTRDGAQGRHQAECDRQIEMGAFLRQVRRGQIDSDFLWRQGQTRGMKRRLNALAAFCYGLVGKPDNVHVDLAGRDHDLNIDRNTLDTLKCNRTDTRHHCPPPDLPQDRPAEYIFCALRMAI